MELNNENKRKLASRLVVNLRSWFSKEDLDMIIKMYEAIGHTKYKALRTYNFALFLVNQYAAYFDTKENIIYIAKLNLSEVLSTIDFNLVIKNMLNNK